MISYRRPITRIENIGLFLNFIFSLKSITGFFRRSEAPTSNKYIIFWACKSTHGDNKVSAQIHITSSFTFIFSLVDVNPAHASHWVYVVLFLTFSFLCKVSYASPGNKRLQPQTSTLSSGHVNQGMVITKYRRKSSFTLKLIALFILS